jgi:hypothetical protein
LQSTRIPSPASEAEKVAGQLEAQTRRLEELKAKLAPAMITLALLSGFSIVQVTVPDLAQHGASFFAWVPPGHQSFQLPEFYDAVPAKNQEHGGFLCVHPKPCS